MLLSEKEIRQFKEIYKKHFGKNICDSKALETAKKLLIIIKAVYKQGKE